jgi:patatin-like phospholipase/acyl hydrolase
MDQLRALSLDGGGFRGIITARWLRHLEANLRRPIVEYFDVVAGTSAGSLNALALACGYTGEQMEDMFTDNGRRIFPGFIVRTLERIARIPSEGFSAPRYCDRRIKGVLKELFPRKFGDAIVRTLVPVYSMTEARALVLDSGDPRHAEIPMWLVGRASSAAPVYFPATSIDICGVEHVVMDGGLAISHPGLAASTFLRDAHRVSFDEIELFSLGTGKAPTISDLEKLKTAGFLEWGTKLIHLLVDAPVDHTDYLCRRIHGDRYHRVQVSLPDDKYQIDDASPSNQRDLLRYADHGLLEVEALARTLDGL